MKLPPNPSLDHLKHQARNLQRAQAAGDEDAQTQVERRLPGYAGRLSLAKAQTVVAREYGFPSWPKLKAYVEADRPRGVKALTYKQSAFIHAVRSEDVKAVRELLSQQPELANLRIRCGDAVDEDDSRSTTALHMASYMPGNEELVALLLESGAEVDALGDEGGGWCTPLSLAVWEGTDSIVRLLLEAGADPNSTTSGTPLSTAMWHNCPERIKMLLDHGAEPTFHAAIGLGIVDRVRATLEEEPAMANVPGDYVDELPLAVAATFEQKEVAEVLVQHGAKVTLNQACGLGMLDRVRTLVEKNPDSVKQVDFLNAASDRGQADVVRYLLGQGADANRAGVDSTAEVIDLLVEAGADVCQVGRGFTPLMRAVASYKKNLGLAGSAQLARRDEESIKALVKHGGLGRFYVVGHWHGGHVVLIESFPELGADVNETDEHGRTALDHAVSARDASDDPFTVKAYTQLIELLQKHGGRRGDGS